MGKNRPLKRFAYDLGQSSKLVVSSFKRTDKRMEFKLLGISFGAYPTVIKASEIECGAGDTKFIKVRAQKNVDDLIILPKTTYQEFDVSCSHDWPVSQDEVPYILFKSLYKLADTAQGEVLESNLKISFE